MQISMTLLRSSKQNIAPQSEQPIDDVPIPDDVYILDSKDIDAAYFPKIKTKPDLLKPVPEDERPKTLEPNWVVPSNDLPEIENNWANAIANAYKDLEENIKANLEGPTFKLVRPFHKNSISIHFQMEECHLLLTDQVDLVNPEGNRVVPDVGKPLPLGGPPDQ
ncbi:hypothetical protein Tco_0095447, partial [Tanacetum coccineum]